MDCDNFFGDKDTPNGDIDTNACEKDTCDCDF